MTDYTFIDGPLAGQTTSLTGTGVGDAILMEVVGYDEDPATGPGLTYVVDTGPSTEGAGRLRYVSTAGLDRTDVAGNSA